MPASTVTELELRAAVQRLAERYLDDARRHREFWNDGLRRKIDQCGAGMTVLWTRYVDYQRRAAELAQLLGVIFDQNTCVNAQLPTFLGVRRAGDASVVPVLLDHPHGDDVECRRSGCICLSVAYVDSDCLVHFSRDDALRLSDLLRALADVDLRDDHEEVGELR